MNKTNNLIIMIKFYNFHKVNNVSIKANQSNISNNTNPQAYYNQI